MSSLQAAARSVRNGTHGSAIRSYDSGKQLRNRYHQLPRITLPVGQNGDDDTLIRQDRKFG